MSASRQQQRERHDIARRRSAHNIALDRGGLVDARHTVVVVVVVVVVVDIGADDCAVKSASCATLVDAA